MRYFLSGESVKPPVTVRLQPRSRVNNGINGDNFIVLQIKCRERKCPTEQAMIIPVRDSMHASGNAKPFDIGTYGRNKVIAQPLLLRFVKGISFVQVPLRGLQDSNPHQRCLPRDDSCLISAILTVQNSTHLAAAAQLRPLAESGVRYAANDPDPSHGLGGHDAGLATGNSAVEAGGTTNPPVRCNAC